MNVQTPVFEGGEAAVAQEAEPMVGSWIPAPVCPWATRCSRVHAAHVFTLLTCRGGRVR